MRPPPSLVYSSTHLRSLIWLLYSAGDMIHFTIPALLCAAALASALPSTKRQDGGSVEWHECEFDFSNPYNVELECGTLTVPLDYNNDSIDATLDLNLVKIKATKDDSLGSMLYNPGGPGESGIEFMIRSVQDLQIITGGYYDLIGFDPRGTGRTLPTSCTNISAGGSLDKRDTPLFSEDLMDLYDRKETGYLAVAAICGAGLAETGHLYGTTYVARDMKEIVDALEEDGMLRYYGTIL